MAKPQSNSSAPISGVARLRYLCDLFMMRWRGRNRFDNARNLSRVSEYEQIARVHGIDLRSSQILEIGVGQRPYLGITLYGLGYDYVGVDLDLPIYPPSLLKLWRICRANGALRAAKTFVRYALFDRTEYAKLFQSLGVKPSRLKREQIFVQCNAASFDFESRLSGRDCPVVVISESVFEHIPRSELQLILVSLRRFSASAGRQLLVLTRPTIFTGICGSHLTEWYHHKVYDSSPKKSEPWEHLRKARFSADTYLNRMTRAEYRSCFRASGFDIVNETVEHPGLGGEFLEDDAIRQELEKWPEEELLSNEVMFELIPYRSGSKLFE